MIYKKNNSDSLDMELFKNPTSEYRGAPFWAWNCKLDEKELLRQIDCLKEMGFGGFHMHTRSGMATKYLGDEFMHLVRSCVDKAKDEEMLAWLYDEDRWPSGSAGGLVTKDLKFAQRYLLFSPDKPENLVSKAEAAENGGAFLLGTYDVELNENGELAAYRKTDGGEGAGGDVWYATVRTSEPSGWYNGHPYVDTMNKAAVERFVEITHEKYKETVGDEFGKTVPAIFTDEPQYRVKNTLKFAHSREDCTLPWTCDFDDTFRKSYGFDIADRLPELFWELTEGRVSQARYFYHDHVCERFVEAFGDTCGKWCADNGICLTGHVMNEDYLSIQTASVGEAMRSYRSFQLPGVDLLCNAKHYATLKQVQSSAHQYGREGVMSELYGVTNWDFDFRGHKFQGDWQAALGVTVRVPHLSWVSMKGSAKRDYPASINYQSPWYREYSYIENHFARLNTVLTRGKPCVKVGVIHPIESYWLHWGTAENTASVRSQIENDFQNIIRWLLFGNIDFDFISESCLPQLCGDIGSTLEVGEMKYEVVLVPNCETLRKSTLDILDRFLSKGGHVIFAGEPPKYVDALPSEDADNLYFHSDCVPFREFDILKSLECVRDVEIFKENGERSVQFIYQLRSDNGTHYLFIANVPSEKNAKKCVNAIIKLKGEYTPYVFDTLNGTVGEIDFDVKGGVTQIYNTFNENDSLLLKLEPCSEHSYHIETIEKTAFKEIDFRQCVPFEREEDNVCLLDIAEYSVDGGEFKGKEVLSRIDSEVRKIFSWPDADGTDVQPYVIDEEKTAHFVKLRFAFESRADIGNVCFCAEELEKLVVNGKEMLLWENGYYVDKSIKRYPIGHITEGENVIEATVPIGKRISIENCFLTGDFDVLCKGCTVVLDKPSRSIAFGDINGCGMPFYGGNIVYKTKITTDRVCSAKINAAKYSGALIKVRIDGKDVGRIVFAPYEITVDNLSVGEHTVEFILFGNRANAFGPIHYCGLGQWHGPDHWYSSGDDWSYEYNFKKTGILKSPVITLY